MALHDDTRARDITRRQEALQRTRDLRIDDHIREAAQSVSGREFLWWLLQLGKVGVQPFTSNALTTAFQCGELNVGNGILERIITVNPAVYVQMQQEHQNEYDRTVSAEADVEHTGQRGASGTPGGYDDPSFA